MYFTYVFSTNGRVFQKFLQKVLARDLKIPIMHRTQRHAKDAVRFGADGIVVSNHGGRQLDGVLSSARALPPIADAVKGDIKIIADSGIRNGLDIVRMLALGADATMLGRAFVYALGAAGRQGVENMLDIFKKEMRVAMTLTSNRTIADIKPEALVDLSKL